MTNDHEKRNDESFDDYLLRLSKLPHLPKDTLKRLLFLPGDSVFSNIKLDGWINACFAGDISKNFINPTYPTKEFIEWVHRETVLERWESLGEKRSSTANNFVALIVGVDDPQQRVSSEDKPSPKPENCFKPDGQDNWRITFKGKELGLVTDTDGMKYIYLILSEEEPIPSEGLYRFCKMPEQENKGIDESFLDKDKKLSGIATQHPEDPMLDEICLKDLKDAKKELEKTIDEIKDTNYLGNDHLEAELYEKEEQLKKIKDHLRQNTKPDKKTGKIKPTAFTSEAKKASGKIHHALKTAYNNIKKESPELATHLQETIKSENNQFFYKPYEDNSVIWEVVLK